jgi:predicted transcriptional regulator
MSIAGALLPWALTWVVLLVMGPLWRRTVVKRAILLRLTAGPCSSYELSDYLGGGVYPALRDLERRGVVSSRNSVASNRELARRAGRPWRVYSIAPPSEVR